MNFSVKRLFIVLLTSLCLATAVISVALAMMPAEEAAGGISLSLSSHATGLSSPVSIANADAGYGRLFVVEQVGRIKIVEPNGTVRSTPFLDIIGRVDSSSSEEGLLGLAFHPQYYDNGYFYVNYTNTTGGIRRTRISRFSVTADPTLADPNSEDILLTIVQPSSNHNAGDIHFGSDGYLYIPLGDGGGSGDTSNNAQTLSLALGKILRIDVDNPAGVTPPECNDVGGSNNFTIPADNPFVGADGVCDLIWAIGLRNPWRSSFDRLTGDFFWGDVGQGSWEEVDHQSAASTGGENYGWRCYEGDHPFNTNGCGPISQYTFPIFEFESSTNCSVIGGYVYRGTQYPAMASHYLVTDYCSGNFWDMVVDNTGLFTPTMHTNLTTFGYVSFGEAADCELYLSNINNGTIYHIQETTLQVPRTASTALCNNRPVAADDDGYELMQGGVLVVNAPGVLGNDGDLDGDGLTAVAITPPTNGSLNLNLDGSFTYTPTANFFGIDTFTYRALDSYDESSLATVTITVTEINTAPVALNDVYTTTWNVPFSVAAPGVLDNDTDVNGDSLTAVLDTPPSQGSLTLLASGAFVYTPTANYTGTDSFTYYAFDGGDNSNMATVSLTIVEGNAPPVAISDNYSTTQDTPLTVDPPGVLANDSDPNGDSLTAVLNTPPISGSLALNLDGSFIYTPNLNFAGQDSFTYFANDGLDNSLEPTTVWLEVIAGNQPPTATDDHYTTSINTPLLVAAPGVLANDEDVNGDVVTAVIATIPVTGSLTLNGDGSFTYTPTLDFTGTVTFTYRATDGQAQSNAALVTIEVTPMLSYVYLPFVVNEP
ncbi:MAG: tandem-95 repeat protein [Ardenticatenaceae bacterium]|nr:tandem-95 repeat protein [Ardenticatenaceae bacterium]